MELEGESAGAPRGPITRGVLRENHTLIMSGLHVAIAKGDPPGAALKAVYLDRFGLSRTPIEWLAFAHYGSHFARAMWLLHVERDPKNSKGMQRGARDLRRQFSVLSHLDPQALKIVDMRYVGGCSDTEIASLQNTAVGCSFLEWAVVLPAIDEDAIDPARSNAPADAQVRLVARSLQFWEQVYTATSLGLGSHQLARLRRWLTAQS